MKDFSEINDIAMNPQLDEFMDIDRYNSLAKASHPEYGVFEVTKKKEKVKTGTKVTNLILKADLVATVALVTAVVGPSIISDHFEEVFSPISCEFVETIAETNEIDYYLSIDSLEKTLGNVELRVTGTNYNQTFSVEEGKNIGEITGLEEGVNYTIALYDGGYLVKKTEVKTITQEERKERAWRKFFENFFNIYYDKEEDLLNIKMKIVDDLDRYEWIMISIYDEHEGSTWFDISPEDKNQLQKIPIRSAEVYGKELNIMVMGYLMFNEEEEEYIEEEPREDIIYEGTFLLDEEYEPNDPIISDVTCAFLDVIPDLTEVTYCIYINNYDLATGEVILQVECGEEETRVFELIGGKNIGVLSDLPYDSTIKLSVYDGEYIIDKMDVKTLNEQELSERSQTMFYPNLLDIYYDDVLSELYITMFMIDDNDYYGGYRIMVESDSGEGEFSFDKDEANSMHSINLVEYEIDGNIIVIYIYGILNNMASYDETLLCTARYNIEEGTYETN